MIFWQIEALLAKYDLKLEDTNLRDSGRCHAGNPIWLSGKREDIAKEKVDTSSDYFCAYDGVVDYLQKVMEDDESTAGKKWADQFVSTVECPECHGLRLQGVARLPHLGQEYF